MNPVTVYLPVHSIDQVAVPLATLMSVAPQMGAYISGNTGRDAQRLSTLLARVLDIPTYLHSQVIQDIAVGLALSNCMVIDEERVVDMFWLLKRPPTDYQISKIYRKYKQAVEEAARRERPTSAMRKKLDTALFRIDGELACYALRRSAETFVMDSLCADPPMPDFEGLCRSIKSYTAQRDARWLNQDEFEAIIRYANRIQRASGKGENG